MMNLDKYQGLIFDLDGTLVHTESAHNDAWQQAMAVHGLIFDENLRVQLGGASTVFMATQFLKQANSTLDPLQLVKEKNIILADLLLNKSYLLPLVEIVKQQHGKKKMAVGTGSSRPIALSILNHFKLLPYFDAVVTATDVSNHKPAPDTFLRCAELIGIRPEECLVFEDADFGIQAAKTAKMGAIDVRVTKI